MYAIILNGQKMRAFPTKQSAHNYAALIKLSKFDKIEVKELK